MTQETTYIDPFSDTGFKAIFGREGMSEEILKKFLNEIFKGQPNFEEIETVQFINNERSREHEDDKTIIHDVICTTDSGSRFIVEMQAGYQKRFLVRAIYYVSRGITDQARRYPDIDSEKWKEEWKYEFFPVIGTFITRHRIPGLPDKVLTHVALTDLDTGQIVNDSLRFAFIQTNYFNKEEKDCKTDLDKILYIIKHMPTLYAIPFKETEGDIYSQIDGLARYANLTPQQKREYDRELKERWDRAAEAESHFLDGKAEGHAEGLAEGHAKGRAEEAREIAKKLKKMGSPMDFITHATGLSAEEVEKL